MAPAARNHGRAMALCVAPNRQAPTDPESRPAPNPADPESRPTRNPADPESRRPGITAGPGHGLPLHSQRRDAPADGCRLPHAGNNAARSVLTAC